METCCKKSNKVREQSKLSLWATCCLLPIRFYRYVISPMLGPKCRFEPSCSHYAEQAITKHGVFRGLLYALKRLSKCHPWHAGGYDPVPDDHRHSSTTH